LISKRAEQRQADQLRDTFVDSGVANAPRTDVGTFGKRVIYPVYHNAESLALADMDRDGRLDAVSLHGGWRAAGVMLQRPERRLGKERLFTIPYATAYTARGLALGDVTGDGRSDLVIADYNYGLIVLKQT
jgi:hypothetical protein